MPEIFNDIKLRVFRTEFLILLSIRYIKLQKCLECVELMIKNNSEKIKCDLILEHYLCRILYDGNH